jgi:hypothetical protein
MKARNDPRSVEDLEKAAGALLKGCKYHFEESVRRVAKISAYVSPETRNSFQQHINKLRKAPTVEEFVKLLNTVMSRWPNTHEWMEWWTRERNAQMIFESLKSMDSTLWSSLPETTNAEEAMHWRIYRAVGKNHKLIDGLYALATIVEYFGRLTKAAKGKPSNSSFKRVLTGS